MNVSARVGSSASNKLSTKRGSRAVMHGERIRVVHEANGHYTVTCLSDGYVNVEFTIHGSSHERPLRLDRIIKLDHPKTTILTLEGTNEKPFGVGHRVYICQERNG